MERRKILKVSSVEVRGGRTTSRGTFFMYFHYYFETMMSRSMSCRLLLVGLPDTPSVIDLLLTVQDRKCEHIQFEQGEKVFYVCTGWCSSCNRITGMQRGVGHSETYNVLKWYYYYILLRLGYFPPHLFSPHYPCTPLPLLGFSAITGERVVDEADEGYNLWLSLCKRLL